MSLVLFLTLCLGIASAAPTLDPNLDAQWHQWKTKHGKKYNTSEEEHRRGVWENNMQIIKLHNKEYSEGKHSFTMEMNAFGDMTSTEFRRKMTGLQNQVIKKGKTFQKRQTLDLPKSVDWRKQGYVSPVKMQGFCNSCWAFSAAGALEGQMFRKTGQLVELSVQNLVDCSRGHGNFACIGGRMEYAFNYVRDNGGLNTEESYPYEEQEGPCRYRPENSAVNVKGFVYVPSNEAALMNAVATVGPISAAINMAFESFQFYTGGIYYEPGCTDTFVNHAVLVVGYGFEGEESDGNHYWLIKNSWGRYWGIDGYMKLAKDRNNHCGIATLPSYPSV
uniref:procathepsin L-like n=1 Tax=Jaculus jaculus TaxID=51337 RepID=UPI001E1AFECD|nr:procathepsin L-like [Jaculus jaculus]